MPAVVSLVHLQWLCHASSPALRRKKDVPPPRKEGDMRVPHTNQMLRLVQQWWPTVTIRQWEDLVPSLPLEHMGVPVSCLAFFLPANKQEIICCSSLSWPVARFGLSLAFSLPLICRTEDALVAQPLAIIVWFHSFSWWALYTPYSLSVSCPCLLFCIYPSLSQSFL